MYVRVLRRPCSASLVGFTSLGLLQTQEGAQTKTRWVLLSWFGHPLGSATVRHERSRYRRALASTSDDVSSRACQGAAGYDVRKACKKAPDRQQLAYSTGSCPTFAFGMCSRPEGQRPPPPPQPSPKRAVCAPALAVPRARSLVSSAFAWHPPRHH